ncbi:hypothetical protein [Sphingomonas montanisoli]|uniref:Uncharacterized protein n=1 Tax=Sphingomonas montanisoli TaxID=2606412 RepID=A0A5D9C1V5_9SPHN|nr:hypothetical protein [Sphingomonas montanisoli]TZG25626.1 hypothetical protein FYJ91_11410 [Sphingomonas montanisoli]
MTHFSIPYSRIAEIPAPATYEIRSGEWWLHGSLENGEARSWGGRHIITINEATGHFTCEGGYGTFSYCWPALSRGSEGLHAFLYDVDFGYFMGKASKQPHRIADHDATVQSLKRELVRDRREGWLTKENARTLWTELVDADDGNTDEMVRTLYQDGGWSERFDCSDPSVMVDHPAMRRFWGEVWKPFAAEVLRPHWEAHRAVVEAAKVAA